MRATSAHTTSAPSLLPVLPPRRSSGVKTIFTYNQTHYVAKEVRRALAIERPRSCERVYPHLLRHSVATTRLERGMPIEQIQQFLGHAKLETTQFHAESSAEIIKESDQRALAG